MEYGENQCKLHNLLDIIGAKKILFQSIEKSLGA